MKADLGALAEFAAHHKASGDIDPVYPVLKHLQRDDAPERAVWRSLVYITWYALASSETAWEGTGGSEETALYMPYHRLPTGVERRNLRDPFKMDEHLFSLGDKRFEFGSLTAWLQTGFGDEPTRNWSLLEANVATARENGRWASYKTAEVMQKVNGFPVRAFDMANANSSGPRKGLARVFGWDNPPTGNSPDTIKFLDAKSYELLAALEERGVRLEIEELETVLCDWNSVVAGHYYVGHDVDLMLGQLHDKRVPASVRERVLEARAATLPHAYLGELNGWDGVDKARRGVYAETGQVVVRGR